MKKTQRTILAIAGVVGTVFGIVFAIPSTLQANYVVATLSAILIIAGLVILAIAFGDYYAKRNQKSQTLKCLPKSLILTPSKNGRNTVLARIVYTSKIRILGNGLVRKRFTFLI